MTYKEAVEIINNADDYHTQEIKDAIKFLKNHVILISPSWLENLKMKFRHER